MSEGVERPRGVNLEENVNSSQAQTESTYGHDNALCVPYVYDKSCNSSDAEEAEEV